jgi:L-2-hydroxyglutarate oxidase LhgO
MSAPVVVVGAGVVGLACAERLSRRCEVVVLERHGSFGRETSSRNSEVVHAGFYYPPGSWKARLCAAGAASLAAWCAEHGVAFTRVGKHVVAESEGEIAALEALRARGEANGVRGLEIVDRRELARREPNVDAVAALRSASSAIVDSHGLMASLLAEARGRRCDVAYHHRLVRAERAPGGYELETVDRDARTMKLRASAVVNAGGLEADAVAALAGIDAYPLAWVKGRYFRVGRRGLVRGLVYPLPSPGLAGLGIHATVDLGGGIRLGPDHVPLADRVADYAVDEGAREVFVTAVSRWLRGIERKDLSPDQAGIRPRLASAGAGLSDFVIAEESARGLARWVNLVGIDSPGLTCALEIARVVDELLRA